MKAFRVTYEIITPGSAENGDFAESGWVHSGGWHDSQESEAFTLREALNLVYPQEDCGNWFAEVDGRQDCATGAEERRSLHPPRNISGASYNRIARVLGLLTPTERRAEG